MSTSEASRARDLETRQLESIEWSTVGGSPPAEHSSVLDLEARIGRDRPIEELGQGGMGRVLRAYDPKLQREVALKLLRTNTEDPTARARLVREARAMAKLSHPNVVAVYDVEDDPVHGVLLAMELVEGTTLASWLREQRRRWPEILAAFVEAGQGLAAAHERSLLHRDFKPSNVLVTRETGSLRGRCKVTDFGLAKLERDQPPNMGHSGSSLRASSHVAVDEVVTDHGAVLGTPRYMAPEQHRDETLTRAADQYAFCVALWEALYGELPFDGATIDKLVANAQVARVRMPTKVHAAPSWLRRACARGLLADPTQRWPSMTALLDALAKGRTRAKLRTGAAAIGVLALLAAVWQAQRSFELARRAVACEATADEVATAWSPERSRALRGALLATRASNVATTVDKLMPWLERQGAAWQAARVEACLDANVHGRWDADTLDRSLWCLDERRMELQSLVDELTRADVAVLHRAVPAAASLASVAECRDEKVLAASAPPPPDAREISRGVRDDIVAAGNLQRAGRYDKGLELARGALERAEALAWPRLVAKARLRVGGLSEATGAYAEAEAELEGAYLAALRGVAPQVAYDAANELVYVVGVSQARHAEGRHWARLAEVALEDVPDGEQLHRASLLVNLASLLNATGDYDQAERAHRQALAIREAALGPEDLHVATSLNNLANVYATTARYAEAKVSYERVLSIRQAALGPEHPHVASTLNNLANINYALGDLQTARELHERVLAIRQEVLGPRHRDVATSFHNLATLHEATGDLRAATELHLRALEILEAAVGPEHPEVASSLMGLANVRMDTGDHEAAEELYQRALAINEKVLGPEHPNLASSLMGLAEVALARHQPGDAVPLARRAVALREQVDAKAALANARFLLARALWDAPISAGRDRARALALAQQARDVLRAAGKGSARVLAMVEQWLVEHPTAD